MGRRKSQRREVQYIPLGGFGRRRWRRLDGHANLGRPAVHAKGDTVFHGGPTLVTGVLHEISRYLSAQVQARKLTGALANAAAVAYRPGHFERWSDGRNRLSRSMVPA